MIILCWAHQWQCLDISLLIRAKGCKEVAELLRNKGGASLGEDEGNSFGEGKRNTKILEVFVRNTNCNVIVGNRPPCSTAGNGRGLWRPCRHLQHSSHACCSGLHPGKGNMSLFVICLRIISESSTRRNSLKGGPPKTCQNWPRNSAYLHVSTHVSLSAILKQSGAWRSIDLDFLVKFVLKWWKWIKNC